MVNIIIARILRSKLQLPYRYQRSRQLRARLPGAHRTLNIGLIDYRIIRKGRDVPLDKGSISMKATTLVDPPYDHIRITLVGGTSRGSIAYTSPGEVIFKVHLILGIA